MWNRRFRPAGAALALVLTAALLAACSPRSAPKDEKFTVRFTEVIHSIFYAPQYVAQAKGFFADEGLEVVSSTAQGSDRGAAALLAGTADIAMVGPETAVFVHNQDSPVKVKIFAQLTARDGSFLLAREKPEGEFSWTDVKGKSIIGWRPGSMPQLVAEAILRQHGLDPETDLEYIDNLAATAMVGAFLSGQGDYIQVFEPSVSELVQGGHAYLATYLGADYGEMPYTAFLATDKFIAEHPDVIQRYTNAIYRAQKYIFEADPKVVAQEVAQFFEGTDVEILASSIQRYRDEGGWVHTPVMKPEDYEKLQDLMIAGGVLEPDQRAPFDAIATNRFAEEAVRQVK
ncbi:ABC transporter substrate-binding protein [Symbiobacterium thermophilum]|nr:ABC transporter substrate-binding protein [Symbiobacterium thermophilum]